MYEQVEHFYLSFPSSVMVIGPSCSGKSTLVKKALLNWSTSICPARPKLKRVIICFDTWQKMYRDIYEQISSPECEVSFFQEAPNETNLSKLGPLADDESQVVIIDDMANKVGLKDNCIERLFTVLCHHAASGSGTQCWFLTQDMQKGGDSMRTIRKNASYIFLMPAVMNGNSLETLQRFFFYRNPGFLPAVAEHVFLTLKRDYLLIDNTGPAIRANKFRLRCGLFDDECEKLMYNAK